MKRLGAYSKTTRAGRSSADKWAKQWNRENALTRGKRRIGERLQSQGVRPKYRDRRGFTMKSLYGAEKGDT